MPKQLSRIKVREISLVDAPASEGADIILRKSRSPVLKALAERFNDLVQDACEQGLVLKVAGTPDDEDEEAEEAEDMDEDEASQREADAQRRARTKAIRKQVARKFAKADRDLSDGQSGGISHSESDRVGDQDNRTAAEKAGDLDNVARAALACPPAPSESLSDWLQRAYGAQLGGLDAPELRTAAKMFRTMQQGTILKSRANDVLMDIAKARHRADPSRGVYAHWADAARENSDLYVAMKKSAQPTDLSVGGASDSNRDFGSFAADGSRGNGFTMIDNGFGGGGAETRSALDVLNAKAAQLRDASVVSGKPLTIAKAFTEVCKAHPEIYAAHKRGH